MCGVVFFPQRNVGESRPKHAMLQLVATGPLQKELNCPKPSNSLFFIANINNGTPRKLGMEDNSATGRQAETGNFTIQAMTKTI